MKHIAVKSKPRPASTVILGFIETKVATIEQIADQKAGSLG